MESCNNQYRCSGSNNLYLYSNHWSMCQSADLKYYCYCTGNTNLYADRTTLPKQYCTCVTRYFEQRICRNMESINDQHCNCWNHDLYLYTNRSVCCCNDDEYCDQCTGNT